MDPGITYEIEIAECVGDIGIGCSLSGQAHADIVVICHDVESQETPNKGNNDCKTAREDSEEKQNDGSVTLSHSINAIAVQNGQD